MTYAHHFIEEAHTHSIPHSKWVFLDYGKSLMNIIRGSFMPIPNRLKRAYIEKLGKRSPWENSLDFNLWYLYLDDLY